MTKYTRLNARYWRYLIKCKGRVFTMRKFHKLLNASDGGRKDELINIYLEVFRASANR